MKTMIVVAAEDVLKVMADLETNDYGEPVCWHSSVLAFLILGEALPDEYLGSFSSLLENLEAKGLIRRVVNRGLTFWVLATDKKLAK